MKLALLVTLTVALAGCSSTPVAGDAGGTAPYKSNRRVSAATSGHGGSAAFAASNAAENLSIESSLSMAVFRDSDPSSPVLKGKNRQVAAATGGHGSTSAFAASAAAANPRPPVVQAKSAQQ